MASFRSANRITRIQPGPSKQVSLRLIRLFRSRVSDLAPYPNCAEPEAMSA